MQSLLGAVAANPTTVETGRTKMADIKMIATALFVAIPLSCSHDRRETQSPEQMAPASGYEQAPSNQTTPSQSPSEQGASPSSPSGGSVSGSPASSVTRGAR